MPDNRTVGRPNNNPGRMEPRSVAVQKDPPRINDERKVKPRVAGQPAMGVRPSGGAQKEPKAPSDKLAGDYIKARDVPMASMTEADLTEWNPLEKFFQSNQTAQPAPDVSGIQRQLDTLKQQVWRLGKIVYGNDRSQMGGNPAAPNPAAPTPSGAKTAPSMDKGSGWVHRGNPLQNTRSEWERRGGGPRPAAPMSRGSSSPMNGSTPSPMNGSTPPPAAMNPEGRGKYEDLGSGSPGPAEMTSLLRKVGYTDEKLSKMTSYQLERAFQNATSGLDRRRKRPSRPAAGVQEGYPDTNYEKGEPAHQSRIGDLSWKGRGKQAQPPGVNRNFIQARDVRVEKVTEMAELEMDEMINRTVRRLGLEEAMGPEVDTITLPAYWNTALVNGDFSGLDDAPHHEIATGKSYPSEADQCRMVMHQLAQDGWHVADVARDEAGEGHDARFTHSYQVHNPHSQYQGGDVLDYVIHRDRGHGAEMPMQQAQPHPQQFESKLPRTRSRW